jgi:hypothetical protein
VEGIGFGHVPALMGKEWPLPVSKRMEMEPEFWMTKWMNAFYYSNSPNMYKD